MSYRSVLNVSNGGPSNPKLTLEINSLRIKRKAQNFPSWMLSEYAFKIGRKKGDDFFDHSTTLISHFCLTELLLQCLNKVICRNVVFTQAQNVNSTPPP